MLLPLIKDLKIVWQAKRRIVEISSRLDEIDQCIGEMKAAIDDEAKWFKRESCDDLKKDLENE